MVYNPLSSEQSILWDFIALLLSFTVVMIVVQVNGVLQKRGFLPTLITRKLVHILVAPVFILTWPLFTAAWYSRYIAAIVPTMFVVLFFAIGKEWIKNEAFVASMSRSGQASELLKGTLYYAIIVVACTLLWFYVPSEGLVFATPNALLILGCLAGGDGLADIVGRRFGRHKYGFGSTQKSIEGSIGMLIGSILFSITLIAVLGIEVHAWNINTFFAPVLLLSLGATVVEALTPKNLDNWTVTISVAIMMFIVHLINPGFWPYSLF